MARAASGYRKRPVKIAQQQLSDLTRSVADELHGTAHIPKTLKGHDRALEKITGDYEGEVGRITDLARSTIVFENPRQIEAARARIGQRAPIVRVKDRFASSQHGYRDVLMNLRMPNGHIVEIQLHLKAILEVKNGAGHALYEQIRAIDARIKSENRPATSEELAKISTLSAEMNSLYDSAFENSIPSLDAESSQNDKYE